MSPQQGLALRHQKESGGIRERLKITLTGWLGVWLCIWSFATLADKPFPTSDITLVVPFGPGGATDVLFRDISAEAQSYLDTSINVVNIAGSGATRGSQVVKEADADGHTLLGSHQTIDLAYFAGLSAYSHHAFAPVALLTRTVNIPATYPGHAAQRASDIPALVAEQDEPLMFGVVPSSTDHLFWLHFFHQTGIDAQEVAFIHYPGTGSQVAGLLAGEIDFAMLNLPSASQLFATNALTPLGVAGEARLMALPSIPTLQEQGIDLVNTTDRGVFAPLNTPPERLAILASAFEHALAQPMLARTIEHTHGSLIDYRPLNDYGDYLNNQYMLLKSLSESVAFER
ncbi:tripartite tricarboxylate transporter substrate binding protein [Halomonas sp. FeN2]|uniref:tripartite tricarboxylate transporter substrate binding protein n=1 Tax=Halomonas sp. FeN2 TaxID=2832500 RepID=UPI000C381732|nr:MULTISPECIES: tripartite tricarboxylate transporter substrate binding protein [unclassified Halomonas]MBF57847.1 tripartite tricarboxylate transporter substrate-binding protein [Halomonas sp.]UBR48258.1 tripartite tricarboxylate transporter substrate binding protein [Halomonas sp. FeN2]|tara:strand:+ start:382 stop:1410 length:1029 start_codon:yes stop_codon:yes gene_type:complete